MVDDARRDAVGRVVRHQLSTFTGGGCWPVSPARIPACSWGCTAWARSCATAVASLITVCSSTVTRSSSEGGAAGVVRVAPLACALGRVVRAVIISLCPFGFSCRVLCSAGVQEHEESSRERNNSDEPRTEISAAAYDVILELESG